MSFRNALLVAVSCLLLVPATAAAQSSIGGRVTDNSAAVMPGVTVEAASPALIEGTRTAVTDGSGQYRIIDLRPGTYQVTFSLPGFNTQVREGLQLPADFAMTVNVVMAIGSINESVTVTGASPVVDTSNANRTEVLPRTLQEELPTGRAVWSYAQLMPGVRIGRPDVGGTSGHQQAGITGAGAQSQRDSIYEIDGLDISMYIGDNWSPYLNPMLVAETSYTTAGIGAEEARGGVRINMIPKEGGNRFSGSFFAGGSPSPAWQADNWSPRLGDLGVQSKQHGDARDGIPHIDRLYDFNAEVGGPIMRDRLWFHVSSRRYVVNNQVLNSVKRDGSPGLDTNSLTDGSARMTWQVNPKNKLSAGFDKLRKRRFTQHVAGEDVQTAATSWTSPHYDTGTAKWTSPVTSRLLAEFGFSLSYQDWDPSYQEGIRRDRPSAFAPCFNTPCFPAVGSSAALAQTDRNGWYGVVNRNDQWMGLVYEAATNETENYPHSWSYKAAISYVTGSHNFKVGFQNKWGNRRQNRNTNGDLNQLYISAPSPWATQLDFVDEDHFAAAANLARGLPPGTIGTPNQVRVYNNPVTSRVNVDYDVGVFGQDSWKIERLTLNLGLRMDLARQSIPDNASLLGRFKPESTLPGVQLPRLGPDFSPRLSAAYDLFGNGKTAVKGGWNRYMAIIGIDGPGRYTAATFDNDVRNWFDLALNPATGGLYPGCSLANVRACPNPYGTNGDDIAQDWEIGPSGNRNFGIASTNTIDPNIKRSYNDQWMAQVQHELTAGVSVSATYRNRSDKNLGTGYVPNGLGLDAQSGDNLLWSFDNFTDAVAVARPGPYTGSFTLFNIDPAVRAALNRVDRTAAPGSISLVYRGFEVATSARLPGGAMLFGGWNFDKTALDRCQDERNRGDDPNRLRFCDQNAYPIPYRHEFKLSGSLPFSLPKAGAFNGGFAILGTPGDGLGESFRYSRSTAVNNQTVYGPPFYTVITCVAPCALGSRFLDPNLHATVGTSPTQFDALILPENSVKFMPRLTQIDANIAKVFNIGRWRYDVRLEAFNLLNNGADRTHFGVVSITGLTSLGLGTSVGAQSPTLYERASNVLDARVLRFAVTARF
jgi:Carboxypeptidase regulatory-like domain